MQRGPRVCIAALEATAILSEFRDVVSEDVVFDTHICYLILQFDAT